MWHLTLEHVLQVAIKSGNSWIYIINTVLILHHNTCHSQYVVPYYECVVQHNVHILPVFRTHPLHFRSSSHMHVWDVPSGGVFRQISLRQNKTNKTKQNTCTVRFIPIANSSSPVLQIIIQPLQGHSGENEWLSCCWHHQVTSSTS